MIRRGPTLFHDLDRLGDAAPLDLGVTAWLQVAAPAVAAFRQAAGLAARRIDDEVPPLMLLSLTNRFLPELIQVPAASNGVNYGAESVRFGPAVRAGQRVRARAVLVTAAPAPQSVQTTIEIGVEAAGHAEPACVVRSLSRWMR